MANLFTTRVELHHASTEDDYEKLHAAMKAEGFSRTIKLSSEDANYKLPTAEYNLANTEFTKEQVLEAAKRAAAKTGKKYAILITKSDGPRLWYGLDVAVPQKVVVKKSTPVK